MADQHSLPTRMTSAQMYATVAYEGDDEMSRPAASLWWSGIAAGLGISMSLLAQGFIQHVVPTMPGQKAIIAFGYCVGFLLVVCGRLQLFTENTITPVLPLLTTFSWRNFLRTGRLWGIVLAANLVGTVIAAWVVSATPVISPEQRAILVEISQHFTARSPGESFFRGIPAGFLVAAMVWMMTGSRGSQVLIIVIMTYIIAIGGLAHVVVGASEVALVFFETDYNLLNGLAVLFSAGAGNILGGTGLFALLAYGQVAREIE